MKRTFVLAALLLMRLSARGQVLYDGTTGTMPAEQGWNYVAIPGTAKQVHTGVGVRLDTSSLAAESAGYARVVAPPLDRFDRFNLGFTFRIPNETHTRPERAGFSVIALCADRRGIELGFWQNEVFAQADQPLFTRGESAVAPFSDAPVDATLAITGAEYRLYVNRELILRGTLRDYTAFTGFPDVYETPNFLFLGDNTTSAAVEVEIQRITLIRPPVVRWEGLAMVWEGIPGETYSIQASPDLKSWVTRGVVESATATFRWDIPSTEVVEFFRIAHP